MANGKQIRVEGRLLSIAHLEGDGYQFVEDLDPVLNGLRKCGKLLALLGINPIKEQYISE